MTVPCVNTEVSLPATALSDDATPELPPGVADASEQSSRQTWEREFARPYSHASGDLLSRVRRRFHQWCYRHFGAARPVRALRRLLRLRAMVVDTAHLGGLDIGAAPSPDAVSPDEIPSARTLGVGDRVLADIDQDGYEFAVDAADIAYFRGRARRLPRTRYRIRVELRHGRVCLSKQFVAQPLRGNLREWLTSATGLSFYTEAAALIQLQQCNAAPRIVDVDVKTRTIYREFIRGESCRQILARVGLVREDIDTRSADEESKRGGGKRRGRAAPAMWARIPKEASVEQARALLASMNEHGVVVLDVKLGNILVGERSGRPYWIDFETARFRADSDWEERRERQDRLLTDCYASLIVAAVRPRT